MKTVHTLRLATAGTLLTSFLLVSSASLAQTSVGMQNSSINPQGTVKDDAMSSQNPGGKKKKKSKEQAGSMMSNGQISKEKQLYRESSSSDGTAINNSNTTNYNSNNVTTAPTGAGSVPVPTTTGTKSTTQPR